MDKNIIMLMVYIVIAIIHFICEYYSLDKQCLIDEKPKLDYCFFRALFFPITWIRLMLKYTKADWSQFNREYIDINCVFHMERRDVIERSNQII